MTPSSKIGLSSALSCAQCEEYLADFLDGTLSAERKACVETHLAGCVSCAEFARDAASAMVIAERTAAVEVPTTLVPQILEEITSGPSRVLVESSLAERVFGGWIRPILQPRFALGLAMAALSIAVIPWRWHAAVPVDLSKAPARVLTMAENRVYRVYDRAVKGYEDLALVAEATNQLDEWRGAVEQDAAPNAPPNSNSMGVQPR